MKTSRNKTADSYIRNRASLFNKFSQKCKEVTYIKEGEITYQRCKLRNGDGCNFKMCPLKKFNPKKEGRVKCYND